MKREKRKYQRQQIDELESTFSSNKIQFWKKIGKLGIQNERKQIIPWEIKKDASVIDDKALILEEWKTHFDDLYKSIEASGVYDDIHLPYEEQIKENIQGLRFDTSPLNIPKY